MNIKDIIKNKLTINDDNVFTTKDSGEFLYSDGASSERYLKSIFEKKIDLSSGSEDLERYIKDWPSEYHLSRKRSQLLSGFKYNKKNNILEVGAGCGAITRFLGETFDSVIAIEGSINRASLARKRTKDLENVSIICAPFQDITFKVKFDIIFCIGVFEYSSSFVKGNDPYDEILKYFESILTKNGVVIIAIENQFGLKYFSSSKEDHLGIMFEGIEGYRTVENKVRTFGRDHIKEKLLRYFTNIEFYYPYSDYKLPDCILSEEFLNTGLATELISQIPSRDYESISSPLFDETLATFELAKNNKLPFFSNSFLIVAGKSNIVDVKFDHLGVLYSGNRENIHRTRSIIKKSESEIIIEKEKIDNSYSNNEFFIKNTTSKWIDGYSLSTLSYINSRSHTKSLEEIFKPCKHGIKFLRENASYTNNIPMLDGKFIDAIWTNLYIDDSGTCIFIDQEWIYNGNIKLNIIVIRSIFHFLSRHNHLDKSSPYLRSYNTKKLIKNIAKSINIELTQEDFKDFISLELKLQKKNDLLNHFKLHIFLSNRKIIPFIKNNFYSLRVALSKIFRLISYNNR